MFLRFMFGPINKEPQVRIVLRHTSVKAHRVYDCLLA